MPNIFRTILKFENKTYMFDILNRVIHQIISYKVDYFTFFYGENLHMFKIAVCDDDEYFRKHMEELINEYFGIREIKCEIDIFASGMELVHLKENIINYDMIFLDINMEGLDGIETAKRIRMISQKIFIIFVTAYVNYSLDGYKVDAIRYLLKDNDSLKEAVTECIDTILTRINYVEAKRTFKFDKGRKNIILDQIVYIESNLHKLVFHVMEKERWIITYSMYEKLDTVEQMIQLKSFCRIHKSYLVNLKYVENIERYKATLWTGHILNIAKPRYKEVKNQYISFK